MATTTVDCPAMAADSYLMGQHTDYATARSTCTHNGNDDDVAYLGQWKDVANYEVYRYLAKFDTTAVPAHATVTDAKVGLTPVDDGADTDADIGIVQAEWSENDPITEANRDAVFDAILAADLDALWANTADLTLNEQKLSASLSPSWVNKGGYTYYGVRSSRDEAATVPTGNEYVGIATQDHATAAYRPILRVTHTTPARLIGLMGCG